MPYKMSRGDSYSETQFGGNPALGGGGGGFWPGGSYSTTPVLNIYFYHIQVLAHFICSHFFFQSALTSSISTQFEIFQSA